MPDKNSKQQKTPDTNEHVTEAYEQAEKDIEMDTDLSSKPEPEDDLDEGELARLEGED